MLADEEKLVNIGENLGVRSELSVEEVKYLSELKSGLLVYMDMFINSIDRSCNIESIRRAKNLLFHLKVMNDVFIVDDLSVSKRDIGEKIIDLSLKIESLGKKRDCGILYFTPLKDLRNFVVNNY